MISYLNYLIESNVALVLFFAAFSVLLQRETDFKVKRAFLIGALLSALIFPLFHLQAPENSIPTLRGMLPTYMLPEILIQADGSANTSIYTSALNPWHLLPAIYLAGVAIFLLLFVVRVIGLLRLILPARPAFRGKYKIVESNASTPPFSFFNFIFLGQASSLSDLEKEKIINHEMAHAKQWHSFDILLLNISGIFFWFNPILTLYKKTLTQLHEFEADAHAVEGNEVDEYCSLLAKVALLSADIKLANHFSHSLTLKRINMMRTLKRKISTWKFAALASVVPVVFLVVSCQDQVIEDLTEITKNSNHALIVPADIQARFEQLKKEHPNSNYILLEFGPGADQKLAAMEKEHGLPKSIELYTPDGQHGPVVGKASQIMIEPSAVPDAEVQTFAILEYNSNVGSLSELAKDSRDVYNVVEDTATPVDGMPAFYGYIAHKLKYPKQAREQGLEGKVFVEFVIQPDGRLSDLKVLKGIGPGPDQEAVRVLQDAPPWNPGKNGGQAVKQRMVLPIVFSLGQASPTDEANASGTLDEVVAVGRP